MISAIGSLDSISSTYSLYAAQQALTPQTKSQLEMLGIDTSSIKTEADGQALLQSSQGSQQTQDTKQTQGTPQAKPAGGGADHAAFEKLKEEVVALAEKLGVSVSSSDKIDDILDAIAEAISKLETEAANNPQKMAQVAEYQAQYLSLCQSLSSLQASMEASKAQAASGASQIQSSMTGLANYNLAGIAISKSS